MSAQDNLSPIQFLAPTNEVLPKRHRTQEQVGPNQDTQDRHEAQRPVKEHLASKGMRYSEFQKHVIANRAILGTPKSKNDIAHWANHMLKKHGDNFMKVMGL